MTQNLIFGVFLLKILFPAYSFFIFIYMCQWTSSKLFFDFRFSRTKSQSQQKLSTKITYFTIHFRSKHLTHFMNLISLDIENNMLRNTDKNFSQFTNFPANMFLFGVRKNLHCIISWHPRTAFLKHFESKCLYISLYFLYT